MNDSNEKEFVTLVIGCAATYNFEMKPVGIELMFRSLTIYDMDDVRRAFMVHMRTSRFFPKIADICEAIAGNSDNDGREMFQAAMRNCTAHRARKVGFDFGPAGNAAIRAIGGLDFLAFEGTTYDHQTFTQARFLEAYRGYRNMSPEAIGNRGIPLKHSEQITQIAKYKLPKQQNRITEYPES